MAVFEIQTFRLAAPAQPEGFIEADRRVQVEFAYRQRGLLRRTTARGDTGRDWLVVTVWASTTAADAAAVASRGDGAVNAWEALVDRASVETRRYQTLD